MQVYGKNMKQIDDIFVCVDCYHLLEIGDATYFDGVYEPEMADQRIYECELGITRLVEIFGDTSKLRSSGKEMDFSRFPCQCCQNKDAGERYKFMVYQ